MNTGACLLGYIYKFKPSNVVDEVGKLYYSIPYSGQSWASYFNNVIYYILLVTFQ